MNSPDKLQRALAALYDFKTCHQDEKAHYRTILYKVLDEALEGVAYERSDVIDYLMNNHYRDYYKMRARMDNQSF